MDQGSRLARLLGFAGSVMGVLAGVTLGSIRIGWINVNPGLVPRPDASFELAGNLGFLFASTMPFVLALIALAFRNPSWRVAIWLGVGFIALFVAFSPVSIATLLLLPVPALVLMAAAAMTWATARCLHPFRILTVALSVAAMAGLAAIVLFILSDASCWELIRSADGQEVWQSIPYSNSGHSLGPPPGPIAVNCTSDIISPIEALLSVCVWASTLIGLALVFPRALPPEPEI